MRGEGVGCEVSANEYSCARGAQINFGDLTSVADPDPGSGMGRKSASSSGIRDEQPGSYFLKLRTIYFWVKILQFFDAIRDTVSGMETVRIRDPGWKKV